MRGVVLLLLMSGVGLLALVLSRWLKSDTWLGRINEFVGKASAIVAVGLLVSALLRPALPGESRSTRMARQIRDLTAVLDSLRARVDSLEVRRP